MLTESDIAQLWNNRFLVSYRRLVAWAYNTWEVWKRALYEYKKEGNRALIRCTYREDRKDLERDEIPEDTWTEKYSYEIIKDWKINKKALEEYHLEFQKEELESLCKWHELNYEEFDSIFRLAERKYEELRRFILK